MQCIVNKCEMYNQLIIIHLPINKLTVKLINQHFTQFFTILFKFRLKKKLFNNNNCKKIIY